MRGIILVEVFPLEHSIGMELYSTDTKGIEGTIKTRFEDFIVEEITPDGTILDVDRTLIDTVTPPPTEILGTEHKARFVHMTVQKMGLNTMDVANLLASLLQLPRHLVSYAGLKDRRAVTVQRMSVPKRSLSKLDTLKLYRIWIRNLEYSRHQVQIGDLWGNRFSILLKNIEVSCDEAKVMVDTIRNSTILNYFGVQRFGVVRPFTHLVGKALLKNNYSEAIRIILTSSNDYESEEVKEIRKALSADIIDESVVERMPKDLRYERDIAKHLSKNPGDYEQAFSKIPPRVQTLFVHSYQSYLFNRLISQLAEKRYSLTTPETGDFLIRLDEPHTGRDDWLFVTEKKLDSYTKLVTSGNYGIAMPIPGYSTKLPDTTQTKLLQDILKEEEIRLLDFRNPQKNLDSPGGLHLVALSLPDLTADCLDEGLNLRFKLRKGSYATVVLRELMKNDPINRT